MSGVDVTLIQIMSSANIILRKLVKVLFYLSNPTFRARALLFTSFIFANNLELLEGTRTCLSKVSMVQYIRQTLQNLLNFFFLSLAFFSPHFYSTICLLYLVIYSKSFKSIIYTQKKKHHYCCFISKQVKSIYSYVY